MPYFLHVYWLFWSAKCLEKQQESELPVISSAARHCLLCQEHRYFVLRVNLLMLQLVTILVGHNDFCSEICYVNRATVTGNIRAQLEAALNYLQDNMPRVLINLLLPLGESGIKGTRHRKCTSEFRRIGCNTIITKYNIGPTNELLLF
jgi:hypothetical protein